VHILQITPRYLPNLGGAEIVVQKTSEGLASHGLSVTVYSSDLNNRVPQEQRINGVLVKRFAPLISDPLYCPEPRFLASMRQEEAEILHVHNLHILIPFLVALTKRQGQKIVLQPHYHRFGQSSTRETLLSLYKQVSRHFTLPHSHIIIANSEYEKRILNEDFSRPRNIVLIPEGLDLSEIERVRYEPVKPKRILYIGVLKNYKNVDKLMAGFAWLRANQKLDVRLIIVGDGPQRDYLLSCAEKLGISSLVEWKSALSRDMILAEYAKASVFTLLSQLESFSRVVYEALLIGVPTVVPSDGPFEHLVRECCVEGTPSLEAEQIGKTMLKAMTKTYPKPGGDYYLDWTEYCRRIIAVYERAVEK
jgi:glycogen(starch) synthase